MRRLRLGLLVSALIITLAHTDIIAVEAQRPLAIHSLVGPGVDIVFLLDNRVDIITNQDFLNLDPQGSRYEAAKYAAEFLALDTLLFNPNNDHSLSIIAFDGEN